MSKSKPTKPSLEADLLHFYDNFVEFHDHCSFLCDAFSSLATEDDYMDNSTAMGASRYSHWVKHRAQELKQNLQQIHKKAYTQDKNIQLFLILAKTGI